MDGEDDWLVRAADREIAGGNQDADSISFEDSERFEGDSDGDSFGSMSDGLNWDWRDAVVPHDVPHISHMLKGFGISKNRLVSEQSASTLRPLKCVSGQSSSLAEIAARTCAKHLAFYQLEHIYRSINMLKRNKMYPYPQDVEHLPISDTLPDTLFLKIVYHCFPANLDDSRLYSVMASGKADNFNHGIMLYQNGYVSNAVQIGYLISANVQDEVLLGSSKTYSVSIKVDRCRVIYSKCSCEDHCEWCSHVCALINFRLHEPHRVQYRVTIWDAINELDDNKLKKFAQYLINELPREHLPMAQRLLDQLSDPKSEINNSYGAPDPTDGGHDAIAVMSYNEPLLHDMFRRQLQSFCMKQNLAHAIDELSSTRHSSSQEFQRHLQPFANLDPPAMQNFIVMMKSMLQRKDPNAISLLRVATEECIANRLVLLHWYCYKLVQSGRWQMISDDNQSRQLNIGQLCDELVNLWRRIALNPAADRSYREQLFDHLQRYHNLSADRIFKIIKSSCIEDSLVGSIMATIVNQGGQTLSAENARFTIDCFPGFYSAMNVCQAMQSFEIRGISIEPFHAWLKWPEQTIELLPEPTPQSPQRKNSMQKKKKSKRRTGRRGNQGPSRRLQRDESSESGQESDQEDNQAVFPAGDVAQVLAACHSPMDPLETRFAQCEAAAVHGYGEHAIPMAMDLMKSVLSHVEMYNEQNFPSTSWTASQNNFEQLHNSTLHRIETLEKTNLISKVLLKNRDKAAQSQLFAFLVKILLCGKFPMTSKHAQVKEHYLENELLKVLQSIDITETEVILMRECADRIRDIVECEGIPPLGLANFILEELSYSNNVVKFDQYRTMGTYESQPQMYRANQPKRGRVPEDDDKALAAAVNSLGVRVPISDLDYPMLSESIRFSKGNLAITLLVSFKEDQEKLGIILDRLLDPRIHQLYKKYFCNSLFFLKDACSKRKYFPGQRPHFPYECNKKKDEPQEQCPNRTEEEVALKKLMSTSVLNQHKQQESKKSVIHVSKGKRLKTRFMANATDAFSTFMFDLGKRVLAVAGGNPNSIFNHVPGGGIQRNLHVCSLLINLYGLGVLNKGKKTNWILRTYSSEVSWIQQQISEIGQVGYEIVREIYWEFHFTPSEMAQLSEKAIQAGHVDADKQACLLSLAILPYAQMLSTPEIRGAISRCKEHSSEDLEKACDGILGAHESTGDISADILFQCSHHYEDLWKEKEKEPNMRKASGQAPQLQHMASYPGAPGYRVQMNQNPYIRRMTPSSPVFNPMQAPVFPQYPESSSHAQLAPDYSNQAGLHQSHSAPQLSNSGGGAASSRQYVSPLIKAYRAGTLAMGAHMRQYEEAIKQNQQRINMYKDDVTWLTDLVVRNFSMETAFDFFENAYKSINCPFSLLHIARQCYQINYLANSRDEHLPPKKNHSNLPPELVRNQARLFMTQSNVPSLQSLITQPPPKLSVLRQHLNWAPLQNRRFHVVTIDLFEKCYEAFANAISKRLNYSSFSEMDRMEAEHVFKGFLQLVVMIPNNQPIVEMFMHHSRRCKHFRSVIPKKDANSVAHGDQQVRQLLTQFSQSGPPAPFSQHYQSHY